MKASKNARLKIAFALTVDSAKELLAILEPYSSATELSVSLSDGSTVYPSTLEEMARLPNPDNRRIVSLEVKNKWDDLVRAEINFDSENRYHSIGYSLRGEDADVLVLERNLIDWAQTIKQRHSWISFTSTASFFAFAIAFLGGSAFGIFPRYFASAVAPKIPNASGVFSIVGLILQWAALSAGWMRTKLFPSGMFAIGAGKQRIQSLHDRRKRLSLLSIGLALVIGLVNAWIRKLVGL